MAQTIEQLIQSAIIETNTASVDLDMEAVLSILNEKHQTICQEIKSRKRGERFFSQITSTSLKPNKFKYESIFEENLLNNKLAFSEINHVQVKYKADGDFKTLVPFDVTLVTGSLESLAVSQSESNPIYAILGNDLYIFPVLLGEDEIPAGVRVVGNIIPRELKLTDTLSLIFENRIKNGKDILKDAIKPFLYRQKDDYANADYWEKQFDKNLYKFIKNLTRNTQPVENIIPSFIPEYATNRFF